RFTASESLMSTTSDTAASRARRQSRPNPLDGELGRMKAPPTAALVPPAFLIDKALAQMGISIKSARERGSLVKSIERRTKNSPGNWSERARMIATQEVAPALERQIKELQEQRAIATNDARMW